MAIGWTLHGDGKTLGPDDVVGPGERLTWGRTIGLGMQHVVAMFGAAFVFPVVMGLNPQLAIMMSGFATLCFLVALRGRVPSYLGSSAGFVGGVRWPSAASAASRPTSPAPCWSPARSSRPSVCSSTSPAPPR